ncbi:hypothetical protein PLICRDRAFT_39529 [Plicaturopsis crispa FD-325 SS-3]|nr:hypothetical protein PLICRDRAFT_39529 [Plicaturopsis crispa FD-325 SS-3]
MSSDGSEATVLETLIGIGDAVNTSSVAALSLIVWDMLITMDDEVERIWRMQNTMALKWVFLFVRYFGLAYQIGNKLMTYAIPLLPPGHVCKPWYLIQMISGQLITTGVDYILMLRIYALYGSNRRIAILFIFLVFAEVVTTICALVSTTPHMKISLGCLSYPSKTLMSMPAVEITVQLVIFSLSMVKYANALRDGWGRVPILKVLMRDGMVSCFILTGLILGSSIVSLTAEPVYAAAIYTWYLSGMVIAGSRIILNLQSVPLREENSMELSTNVFERDQISLLSPSII